jgi:hypothetical protein
MDHGDDVCTAHPLEGREGTSPLRSQRSLSEHGRADEQEDQEEDPDREDGAEVDGARIRSGAASRCSADGWRARRAANIRTRGSCWSSI